MKKLLFWAVLLMTGFAFYSCDERFDNPVTQQQDPSNPMASWSYEVSVKFARFNNNGYNDVDGKRYTYTAPSTIYVYNKALQKLGELTVAEPEEFPDSFVYADFDKSYKFAGKLQGAIGEELIISTLEGFDYYSKQDGTQKTLMKSCILQTAEVPIIITNATKGTIGTQSITLKNKTWPMRARFYGNWAKENDKSFKIASDSLLVNPAQVEKEFTIKFAEDVKPRDFFFYAIASIAEEQTDFEYTIESENGYVSVAPQNWDIKNGSDYIYGTYGIWFEYVKSLDLTKYFAYLEEENPDQEGHYWIDINTEKNAKFEPFITQSGNDAVEVDLVIQGKATIQGINIGEKGSLQLNGYKEKYYEDEYDYLPILTVKGTNTVYNKDFAGICINATATIKGDGSITSTGDDHGLVVNSSWNEPKQDESGWSTKGKASELTIAGDVTIIAKGLNGPAVFIGKPGAWSYPPYSEETVSCAINFEGGSLEAIGKGWAPGIVVDGKMTIGTGITSLKATAGETSEFIIVDGPNVQEAALDILVADKTKFTDKTEGKVRTITPKK